MGTLQAKVLTVSDGVAGGTRDDHSGPALVARLREAGYAVIDHQVVGDGAGRVADALRTMVADYSGLIVTTGGTGFAPTDLTPEATASVLDRQAPGLAEAMRAANPAKRPLSRGVAGTAGHCIILNTPGSTAGAIECLDAVLAVLAHALALLEGEPTPHPG
ncbi:MAG TPA: MogA/MoaB family molybdenum cofactor biosynthesis protein [Acidimicrobiales bacterium]|nr:MogA/MoaB family molybdenum cofactor biosynthesis protein [Acidimicrobiales bacterium]